ncbi:pyrroloquinoline quinone biosynthesis protein PqqE [Pseudomonas sp. R5(2019)]|uniref:pyrroloquinoline quinone biosynthesis protein PqqE n=1 Tax=Pseudomonas sp. R5(2019) TaxID=2697566 RepID=UPI001411EE76|nr:pyrroloquinoline quinone biosynthesis protein PqqE [Pseudomonas sp. R5(2019)]NBA96358.1 pyrroloquinoline quinone biosynthesis protein PqqE [Pseudomonas sp. R5(2019)]
MEVTASSAFYAGLGSIQAGQNRVDQAASQIANTSVERSATSAVELSLGKAQVELGGKLAKASDEMLGTLIDTYA